MTRVIASLVDLGFVDRSDHPDDGRQVLVSVSRAGAELIEAERRANEDIPLRRLGEPQDFAGLAVYLASDASRYMTGQALTVCGGSNMWT